MKSISMWVVTLFVIALCFIPSTFGQVNVTGTDLAPILSPGVSAPILRLRFICAEPQTVSIDTIKVELTGTANTADIVSVQLWKDDNGNDTVDGGESQVTQGNFSADRKLTLSGNPIFSVPDFATVNYLLIYSINIGANASRTVGANMGSTDVISNFPLFEGIVFAGITTSNQPLPVQIVSFIASPCRTAIELRWSTTTEANSYGFEIEKRPITDPRWQKIAFVAGAGTSTALREYTFVDRTVSAGRHAYRLKQIDNDGSFAHSYALEVEVSLAPRQFRLSQNYPNPFNPSTDLEFILSENGAATLSVCNMLGEEVAMLFEGAAEAGRNYQIKCDASRMASGVYLVRLISGGKQLSRKMVLLE